MCSDMTMNNIVKCSYCGQIMIAELFDTHECDIPWKDSKEIPVSSFFDCSTKKGQKMVGVGLDGVHYWFVLKKREAIPISDKFTQPRQSDEDYTEPPFDSVQYYELD